MEENVIYSNIQAKPCACDDCSGSGEGTPSECWTCMGV